MYSRLRHLLCMSHAFMFVLVVAATLRVCLATSSPVRAGSAVHARPSDWTNGRAAWRWVDPFIGTSGTAQGGPIDTYPGASLPFGMIQWSPDTPSEPAGGGYDYTDHTIEGFGLTHLSGPGCSVMGDIDILPMASAIVHPWSLTEPFSHASEVAHPGWYAVTLGDPAVRVSLTVTRRTGLGRFLFPAGSPEHVLFKVSSDQAGVSAARFRVVGRREVEGSASSGWFCGMPDRFTVYFVARFNRPILRSGTWFKNRIHDGARSVEGVGSGGWVTFATSRQARPLEMQVAISYVSLRGALVNLRAGARTWSLRVDRRRARSVWARLLGRIRVRGGTPGERVTFYTALYHVLLQPTLFSDADGRYIGFDGKIHRLAPGEMQYANFSGWDIYRTEIPLLALLVPRRTSEMMQSLLRDARQGGWLPKWPLANGYTGVMGGDSADPILAGAYAFGARAFDVHEALRFMVRGASLAHGRPGQGWYVERPGLSSYLQRGYVGHGLTTSVAPVPNGASETLEYSLDDFAISRLATALGDEPIAARFLRRSMNWSHLLDTAAHEILPRNRAGAFLDPPITNNGQSGFQEGNAAQYTWLVPQDLTGLIEGLGGRRAVRRQLDRFFTHLNAGQSEPYAWLGNEPTIGSPWVYLADGAPWRAQAVLRRALTTLYLPTPAGLPGNDDLGTMSAWYVWTAMGLYPWNPPLRDLEIGSPLFQGIRLRSPSGLRIVIRAPQAAPDRPYIHALLIDGRSDQRTWFALPERGVVRIDALLSTRPDRRWGAARQDAPPSFAAGPLHFPPSTLVQLLPVHRQYLAKPGEILRVGFRLSGLAERAPTTIRWWVTAPHGFTLPVSRGMVRLPPAHTRALRVSIVVPKRIEDGYADVVVHAVTTSGALLPALVVPLRVAPSLSTVLPLLYSLGNADNSVVPIDPTNGALGPRIAVGDNPVAAVFGPRGRRLFVADSGSNALSVIDTRSQKVVATLQTGPDPVALAIDARRGLLWVVNEGNGTLESFGLRDLAAGRSVVVGPGPDAITIDHHGRYAYVALGGANEIATFSLQRERVIGTEFVGGPPTSLTLSPHGRRLYVVESNLDVVVPIDLSTRRVQRAIAAGLMPGVPALSPTGRLLYVPDYATNRLTIIDPRRSVVVGTREVGLGPFVVIMGRGGRTVYVSNGAGGTLWRLDRRTGRKIYSVRTVSLPISVTASW